MTEQYDWVQHIQACKQFAISKDMSLAKIRTIFGESVEIEKQPE